MKWFCNIAIPRCNLRIDHSQLTSIWFIWRGSVEFASVGRGDAALRRQRRVTRKEASSASACAGTKRVSTSDARPNAPTTDHRQAVRIWKRGAQFVCCYTNAQDVIKKCSLYRFHPLVKKTRHRFMGLHTSVHVYVFRWCRTIIHWQSRLSNSYSA